MPNDGKLDKISASEWEAPLKDELGSPVDRTRAFRVSTNRELAEVLSWAAERSMIVSPVGSLTSSSNFKAPPDEWMEKHGKKGVVLIGFSESEGSEFARVSFDMDRMEVTAGAAVSLKHLSDLVGEEGRGQLENRMTITTMDAKLVATLLGSGGVSDSALSVDSLATASEWIDGKGEVHSETYTPGDYFDYSSFNPVTAGQVGKEMSGRGGPFGVGLNATIKLFESPKQIHRVVYAFRRDGRTEEDVQTAFLDTIVELNQARAQKGLELEPRAFEIMDAAAMKIAREAMGWAPPNLHDDTDIIIIAEFAQMNTGDPAVMEWLFENGFIPDAYMADVENIQLLKSADASSIEKYRLFGPDEIRNIRKRKFPKAPTISTDFAVDAADSELVRWYGSEIFKLQRQLGNGETVGVLYGHGFKRFDPHYRVVVPDQARFKDHEARLLDLGHRFVEKEMTLRAQGLNKMRERGEKPELAFGFDHQVIGKKRTDSHRASNNKLLDELDPNSLFLHRAAERWNY